MLKGSDLGIVSNEGYLLQEMSSSSTKYVSQISINTTTYHHSRSLIITPRFESLERIIVSFQTAILCKTLVSITPNTTTDESCHLYVWSVLVTDGVYHTVNEIAHAQKLGLRSAYARWRCCV